MASWAPERRKMSIPPDELYEARMREAAKLLAWSASGPTKTYEKFCEEEEEK